MHSLRAAANEDLRRHHTTALTLEWPPGEALVASLVEGLEEGIWSSRQTSQQCVDCDKHRLCHIFQACLTPAQQDGYGLAMGLSILRDDVKDAIPLAHKCFLTLIRRQIEAWAAGEILRLLLTLQPLPEPAFPVRDPASTSPATLRGPYQGECRPCLRPSLTSRRTA